MSEDPAPSSEQNDSSYQTKASSLRMSEKKCCKFWPKGGLRAPRILSREYSCNPSLGCLVGVRSNSLTWEWKTKSARGSSSVKKGDSRKQTSVLGASQRVEPSLPLLLSLPEPLSPGGICVLNAKNWGKH